MRAPLAVMAALLAACTPAADKQAKVEQAARTAIAAESTVAAAAASLPSTGKWDEPHLVERLVRAGLAPQAKPGETGEKYWKAPVLVYQVGNATLHAYIYSDSLVRKAVVARLDTLQAAPPGATVYPPRHILIVQNNLAAVLVGGSDVQQDRVRLAIEAGLPAAFRR
jgi:hypothetical protein